MVEIFSNSNNLQLFQAQNTEKSNYEWSCRSHCHSSEFDTEFKLHFTPFTAGKTNALTTITEYFLTISCCSCCLVLQLTAAEFLWWLACVCCAVRENVWAQWPPGQWTWHWNLGRVPWYWTGTNVIPQEPAHTTQHTSGYSSMFFLFATFLNFLFVLINKI